MALAAPITLKAADVIAAARKAYEEGRLSAQGPTPECAYRDDSGRPCAIGAALTDEQYGLIAHRIEGCRVGATNALQFDDVFSADKLQRAHDAWTRATRPVDWTYYENAFRKLIGLDPLPVEG